MKNKFFGFWKRLACSKAFKITVSVYIIVSPIIKMYIAWRNLPPSDNRVYIAAGLGIAAEGAWYLGFAIIVAVLAAIRRMYFEVTVVELNITGIEVMPEVVDTQEVPLLKEC